MRTIRTFKNGSAAILSVLIHGTVAITPASATDAVVAWGANYDGQTSVPGGLSNVVAIAGGNAHSLALSANGTVAAWGSQGPQTRVPEGLSNVVAIAAGRDHSTVLRADGKVISWGLNGYGQTNTPAGLGNVVAIACGQNHNLALRDNGTVAAWGWNEFWQTDVPVGLTNVVAIACGNVHSLALRSDGRVFVWGHSSFGETNVPENLGPVMGIANCSGGSHNVALKADGTVAAWGLNGFGQTDVPALLDNVVAVAGGVRESLALRADGRIVGWGATLSPDLANVAAIACGDFHSLALVGTGKPFVAPMVGSIEAVMGVPVLLQARATGQWPLAYAWEREGIPLSGQTNALLNLTVTNVEHSVLYRCRVSNALGVATSSTVRISSVPVRIDNRPLGGVAWIGQPWSFTIDATAAFPRAIQWVKDGQVMLGATGSVLELPAVQWRDAGSYSAIVSNRYGMVTSPAVPLGVTPIAVWGSSDTAASQSNVVSALVNITAIKAGGGHNLALRRDGAVVAWLTGQYADVGQARVPAGLTDAIAIAAGARHSMALRADGKVVAWGYNGYGQTNVPSGLGTISAIACGGDHSLALRTTGTVAAWGKNTRGQTSVPAGLANVVAIAAGAEHSLALRADGSVLGWGKNFYGQTDVPAGLSNVTAIAAGRDHSLALVADGTLVAWGDPSYGQSNVPLNATNVVAITGGDTHYLAFCTDGTLREWGSNNLFGKPVAPPRITNVVSIAAGSYYSLALIANSVTPPPAPVLSVTPASRDFGSVAVGTTNTQTFSVRNLGGLTLTGTVAIQSGGGGFSITGGNPFNIPGSGTGLVNVAFAPVTGGTYTNKVIFSSNGGTVTNVVTGVGLLPAILGVTPASLNFGTVATGATVQASFVVTNSGGTQLTGSVSVSTGAFTAVSSAFALGPKQGTNIAMQFAPLSAGMFSNNVTFTSNGGTASRAVLGIGATTPLANFTANPTSGIAPLNVGFTDTSSGTITNRAWTFGDGLTTNTTSTGVSHRYARAGVYTVTLTVSGPVGTNSRSRVSYVQVTEPPPTLSCSPVVLEASCRRGENAPAQSFDVWNSGGGSCSYTIAVGSNAVWLGVNPTSGNSTGELDRIQVNYMSSGLATGVYSGSITITALGTAGSPRNVGVTLHVRQPQSAAVPEFTGDRKADMGVFHASASDWYIRQSADGMIFTGAPVMWGGAGIPIPLDFDGDGLADFAVFLSSEGNWRILRSTDGVTSVISWGWSGAIPVAADYDGDGRADAAVYEPPTAKWYIRQSSDGQMWSGAAFTFGWSETIPVPADYDGDGKTDLAAFWPAQGLWYIRQSSTGVLMSGAPISWGWAGNLPVPGDYDGDGKADIAIYDPPTGQWHVRMSSTGGKLTGGAVQWGAPAAMPVPSDYDGDGKTDITVYVSANTKWYIRKSSDGTLLGGGNNAQNGGIPWGHRVVTPANAQYQTLKQMGLVP